MTKFKVGEIVKIKDVGSVYSTYTAWFHITPEHLSNQWDYGRSMLDNYKGKRTKIKYLGPHLDNENNILALVNIDNKDFIIGTDGLEKIEDNKYVRWLRPQRKVRRL